MFDILLSDQSDHPLYLQLYRQIRGHIRSGVIANDTRLPSVRTLQHQLNISKTPIETAYQMLAAEGYVVSKPRSGLYAVNPNAGRPPAPRRPLPERRREAPPPRSVRTPPPSDGFIDFNPTAVDRDAFPVRLWKKMLGEALEQSPARLSQYGDAQGEMSLRAVLADYLLQARGVACAPEQLVIGSGISYSIGLLTKLLTDKRCVAVEEPGFAPVRDHFAGSGFRVVPIPVHERGLSVEGLLASEAEVVYVTPSHQFPTGSVMPYAEREYLLRWANERGGYIVEDDYNGEFRYIGKPIPSLQSLDEQGRVAYIGTFSKAFTPAVRLNYMVLPIGLLEKLGTMPHLLVGPSRVEQWAMQAFIEQGHWYRHIRKMRHMYRKKQQKLIELLQAHFAGCVEITGHSAGLHIQAAVRTDRTAAELLALAAAAGVRVYDMAQSPINGGDPGEVRIYLGFAGLREGEMEAGVRQLKKAWSGRLDEAFNKR
ncbi:MocR-like pyridoxine biosynthesis transcription factor PdxR [Paenibacillus arenilitoris]|uniref:PLP-dependent aminotransferase family protein n=1 Tax=Paenibacillus arenilitoris TaxID=2772299 RepID=A0A927CIR0_9BACL|nr:PLP-dependent aminotransferase family protein [Paenibacillus arenilitoris]MBD2868215.1 PLP-dependent aminotransferase family protein [Paenibacillus arenilitoris]